MATYEPLPFPRRPKSPSIAGSILYQAQLSYYRYEINTGLYVMSPGEKLAFNLVNLTIAALLLSMVYYFLPLSLVGYAQHLVGGLWESLSSAGLQERKMQGALLQGLLPGEVAATLREGGMGANASTAALPGMF
jgi:Na+-transporting NADH:ubiquinone oxidoreductase subunit NqrB